MTDKLTPKPPAGQNGRPNKKPATRPVAAPAAIEWRAETRKLSDLKAYAKNPRRFTDKGMADLRTSLDRFGLAEPVVINQDNEIIGGHARVETLRKLRGKNAVVPVYVPDRLLSPGEVAELCVRLNKNIGGEFNFDALANAFDPADLLDWGFTPQEIGVFDPAPAEGQGQLDRGEPKDEVTCPDCGHAFRP